MPNVPPDTTPDTTLALLLFSLAVVALLALDMLLFHRRAREMRFREAILWVAFWVGLALAFNVGIYFMLGREPALQFLTAYLVEESLSVDNIFVFLMIFSYFGVPMKYQHRVLFWGIVGAMVMRVSFILAGVELIKRFHWVIYVFGAFLVLTGLKMALHGAGKVRPERNPLVRLVRRFFPVTNEFAEQRFFVRRDGRRYATPLFITLLAIETTDVLFAVDSIPAVLSITTDFFIVYTSNICAILGLRAIFFVLAGMMKRFRYLRYGLAVILIFVGVKMLIESHYKIPVSVALGVVAAVLLVAALASILISRRDAPEPPKSPESLEPPEPPQPSEPPEPSNPPQE